MCVGYPGYRWEGRQGGGRGECTQGVDVGGVLRMEMWRDTQDSKGGVETSTT